MARCRLLTRARCRHNVEPSRTEESPSLDKRHRHTGSEKWVFKMNAAVSKCERICRKAYMNSQGEEVGKVLHTTTLTVFSPSDGGRQVG